MHSIIKNTGLTLQELNELLEYVATNHSWKDMYNICNKHPKRKIIKYVDFSMDTRSNEIWRVGFRNVMNSDVREKEFRTERGYNLKDQIYQWLKEE